MPFNLFCHIGRKNLIFRADPSNNKKTLPKPEGHFSIGFEKKIKVPILHLPGIPGWSIFPDQADR